MQYYDYYLLNVFAQSHFGGNPLAVFPQADGLSDTQMQLIARQFNLSETVFIQTATQPSAVKKLKIFTPNYELPFAGHPTIGASFIIRELFSKQDCYQIETLAGLAEIRHQDKHITFALKNGVKSQPCHLTNAELTEIFGLQLDDIAPNPMWVNTGTWQLLVRLNSESAVKNCQISTALFMDKLETDFSGSCYLWFANRGHAKVRMFFTQDNAVIEDPGTGSAAANLGGWHILQNQTPITLQITQGDELNRPNRLTLHVDEQGTIFVGGEVIEVGKGSFAVPNEK